MKDYEALSKKHFDGQAAEYDQRDTYYYSQNGKISCRDIAEQVKNVPYHQCFDGCIPEADMLRSHSQFCAVQNQ